MRYVVLAVIPLAVLIGLVRPAVLLAAVLLAAFVAAVARVGLWLLGDEVAGSPEAHAARVGAGAFAAAVAVLGIVGLLGPASVPVLALLAVLVAVPLLRPGRRRASWLRAPIDDFPSP